MESTTKYQGYTNAQTWSVALYFEHNREAYETMKAIAVRNNYKNKPSGAYSMGRQIRLYALKSENELAIVNSAPWAWINKGSMDYTTNWTEAGKSFLEAI